MIHSKPTLNVNVYRNFGLKIPGCYGGLIQAFLTYSLKLHSSLIVSAFLRNMFDVGDLPVPMIRPKNSTRSLTLDLGLPNIQMLANKRKFKI